MKINTYFLLVAFAYSFTAYANSSFNGNWETGCVILGKHSYISQASFTDDVLNLNVQFFESQTCTSPTVKGTYQGTVVYTKSSSNLQSIEHYLSSSHYTLLKQDVVDQWNDPQTPDGCGRKDWQINIPFEVSGQYCRPFKMPVKNSKILDLLLLQEGKLSFGRSPAIVGQPAADQRPKSASDLAFIRVR